ncbi:metallophosphoesterase [Clostridioides difficile]|uniref:metallophosphoesterase n=1 Tax=Clostridioides difficile TaxID=1496 RepID=UPI000D1E1258|nr:metallophosphoesterase [Clostridioides difficile]MDL5068413.1 metallophosphoesterase [Clostridioides difficile]MDN9454973.1 metallophosphoesterase [Clostridioides difficile]HBF7899752.1 metallophosphoesterase [Clostridioides difficile]
MKIKFIIVASIIFLIVLLVGCQSTKDTEINVLATSDLHSIIPDNLISYVEEERKYDENLLMVDAGDFFDMQSGEMNKWFTGQKLVRFKDGIPEYKKIAEPREGEVPLAKKMAKLKYDAVTFGNHEFVSNDKQSLDNLVSDFKNNNIPLVSANVYEQSGENYVKPYVMKNINTDKGAVKVGILGLTIKEVGERSRFKSFEQDKKARELGEQPQYKGKLYANDLVEDANKWVKVMEKKEKPDIIVAIVHSGEEPKNPKNPGNRIKELATTVEGIDAIVAGHTHEKIEQHTYKNNSGEEVIVTQPGAHGNSISKINFKLDKKNDKWFIKDKYSELKVFGKEVNIITTSGLNPKFSDEMAVNLFNERDRDVQPIFIDAGDFLNTNTKEMTKWAKEWQYNENKGIYKKINEWPIVYLGYDAVVLGSHEFTEDKETFEEKKSTLDYIIENFEEMKIPVLSANIYDESGENYVKPYIIHNVETREGNIKVGVLGLTTTDKDEEDLSSSSLSKDSKTSKIPEETGKLYTNNLVKDASEWVKVMQKESPDVIVAVVHSDNNSTLKNPSSEVKKLAISVDGIDAIVVGHTKNKVEEHIYKNKSGDEVIVTQSGEDCYSKISLELRKENGKWNIINKYSKAIKMK